MCNRYESEGGFTGLEAAIVLIAFDVVASVFSYVILGAGFFTTQKAQETVFRGVEQSTTKVRPSFLTRILSINFGEYGEHEQ